MTYLTLRVYDSAAFLYRHEHGDYEPEARFFIKGYDGAWDGELFSADFNEECPVPIYFVSLKSFNNVIKYCETAAKWHGCELEIKYISA